ncbi:TraM recognition domain-containing protein [Microbacterium sp. 2FI]|uniref:type IV secretory system conjugative DNA transfer family protein n=1 Tax=Microbacterium sp. 2FI TaxID=2502193 RepID=UPI0010F84120|nr:TraM recognition domain-containing protein [Microbacterium sp. 2FI]
MNQGMLGKGIAVLIAIAVVLSLTFGAIAHGVTQLVCGAPAEPSNFISGLWFAITGDPAAYLAPAGCALPLVPIRVADVLVVLLAVGGVIAAFIARRRYLQSDRAFIADLHTRPGFATASEVNESLSGQAVLQRADQLRRDIAKPKPSDVGWRVGRAHGKDVYVSIEDSVALIGPPRSGKGYRVLISAIIDWSGPLVTTSTTNDNLTATLRMRQQRGEVHVFDPQGLSGVRHPIRISPFAGCEDPIVAMQRGTAIITGTALGTSTTNAEWAQASSVALGRLLHAGAVGGKTIRDLYSWGTNPSQARKAVKVLRTDGERGWGDALEGTLSGDEKLLSSIWFGVSSAVAPLAVPQIRDALTPRPGDRVFDAEEFLDAANTMYLIGSSSGAAAMGGFLGAMLDGIVEVARKEALASPGARLVHPLGLILDEIVNMFRWGNLPRIMSDGGGRGICPLVVLQALSQAETAWSRAEADTIWAAATAKVLLGGASHVEHLRDIEALLGTRDTQRTQRSWSTREGGHNTSEQHERRPLMSVDEIRRIPPSVGLLAYRNQRNVLLELTGWDKRRDASVIQQGKREVEEEQREVFAASKAIRTAPAAPAGESSDEAVTDE